MTDAQREQFNKLGCYSRCIIKLAEWHNKPISADDFVNRFQPRFRHWDTKCGMLMASDAIYVCRKLKICRHADLYRDSKKIRELWVGRKTFGIFVLTDYPTFHCSLLDTLVPQALSVWSPNQDGSDSCIDMTDEMLDERLAHFLVLL